MSKFLVKEVERQNQYIIELKYKLWFWRAAFCIGIAALTASIVAVIVICGWYYGDIIMQLVAQIHQLGGTI